MGKQSGKIPFLGFILLSFVTLSFLCPLYAEEAVAIDAAALFKSNCKTCHNIGTGDVVGPDLKDFHTRQPLDWAIPWIKSSGAVIRSGDAYAVDLFDKYNGVEMPDQNLSEEEIIALYNYIKEESAKVVVEPVDLAMQAEDDSSGMFLFILAAVLFVLVVVLGKISSTLTALLREKQGLGPDERTDSQKYKDLLLQNKPIISILVIAVLIMGMKKGFDNVANLGIQHGYAPEQPINFSHDKHAGEMQIDCQYCHSGAEKSKNAGIPSANVCMNCHSVIKKDSEEIQKIFAAVENNQPIEWIKVHNLPDHVYFNHAQHVKVGGIECQKCHGPVEEMKVVEKHHKINMGFCLDCHRTTAVKFEENAYYDGKYEELHEKLKNKEIDFVSVKDIGGTECQKCHY